MLQPRIHSILENTIRGFTIICCPIAGTVSGIGQIHEDSEHLLSTKFVGPLLITRFQDLAALVRLPNANIRNQC
jgi:hypothetical protein